ncbi:MAG TPA: erythromycin esterase family protein [Thermoanaerobaculia bacterium]|nr:erythromycin esterase family protein [Thermoanaerobaculia bacterium]
MSRTVPVFLALVLTFSAYAAPKRRAVAVPPSFDTSTIPAWLAANAQPLASTELQPYTYDLAPLRALIGPADVVALGEGTHGTHEFHTVKLRVADYLVRELGFDVIALEAPFPLMNKLNEYAQGNAGDPRPLLATLSSLGYFFWNDEEVLALIEWLREWNAHRGTRPPVVIAGMDVLDEVSAADDVVAYLRAVDPPASVKADEDYACIRMHQRTTGCFEAAARVFDTLAARATELASPAYDEALHEARVVVQSQFQFGPHRDDALAENALWIRQHRGVTRRVIVWAHNEHVSKSESEWAGVQPMGRTLFDALGSEYFAIATLTGGGTFNQWAFQPATQTYAPVVTTFPALTAQSYESLLRQSAFSAYFVSLRVPAPSWLATPSRYNAGTTNAGPTSLTGSLPAKFDAAIYIDRTTPTRVLH